MIKTERAFQRPWSPIFKTLSHQLAALVSFGTTWLVCCHRPIVARKGRRSNSLCLPTDSQTYGRIDPAAIAYHLSQDPMIRAAVFGTAKNGSTATLALNPTFQSFGVDRLRRIASPSLAAALDEH